jgi:hypothetical protein
MAVCPMPVSFDLFRERRKSLERSMEIDGLSIVVTNIIIGAVLLLFGRYSFWLFVGCIGFAVGLQYAPLVWDVKSPMILIVLSTVTGIVGAVLAVVVQKIAIALAGFAGGAYITTNLLNVMGLEWGNLFWLPFVVGGIIGAIVLFMVFDWALIVVSSFAGAMLIVQNLDFNPRTNVWLLCVLFVLGMIIQTMLFMRARSAGKGAKSHPGH